MSGSFKNQQVIECRLPIDENNFHYNKHNWSDRLIELLSPENQKQEVNNHGDYLPINGKSDQIVTPSTDQRLSRVEATQNVIENTAASDLDNSLSLYDIRPTINSKNDKTPASTAIIPEVHPTVFRLHRFTVQQHVVKTTVYDSTEFTELDTYAAKHDNIHEDTCNQTKNIILESKPLSMSSPPVRIKFHDVTMKQHEKEKRKRYAQQVHQPVISPLARRFKRHTYLPTDDDTSTGISVASDFLKKSKVTFNNRKVPETITNTAVNTNAFANTYTDTHEGNLVNEGFNVKRSKGAERKYVKESRKIRSYTGTSDVCVYNYDYLYAIGACPNHFYLSKTPIPPTARNSQLANKAKPPVLTTPPPWEGYNSAKKSKTIQVLEQHRKQRAYYDIPCSETAALITRQQEERNTCGYRPVSCRGFMNSRDEYLVVTSSRNVAASSPTASSSPASSVPRARQFHRRRNNTAVPEGFCNGEKGKAVTHTAYGEPLVLGAAPQSEVIAYFERKEQQRKDIFSAASADHSTTSNRFNQQSVAEKSTTAATDLQQRTPKTNVFVAPIASNVRGFKSSFLHERFIWEKEQQMSQSEWRRRTGEGRSKCGGCACTSSSWVVSTADRFASPICGETKSFWVQRIEAENKCKRLEAARIGRIMDRCAAEGVMINPQQYPPVDEAASVPDQQPHMTREALLTRECIAENPLKPHIPVCRFLRESRNFFLSRSHVLFSKRSPGPGTYHIK